jgi:hypothetical protein
MLKARFTLVTGLCFALSACSLFSYKKSASLSFTNKEYFAKAGETILLQARLDCFWINSGILSNKSEQHRLAEDFEWSTNGPGATFAPAEDSKKFFIAYTAPRVPGTWWVKVESKHCGETKEAQTQVHVQN